MNNKNPLTGVISGPKRQIGYAILFVIGVSIGGTLAGFAAVGAETPKWLLFVSAFYTVVTGPTWSVPFSNVRSMT